MYFVKYIKKVKLYQFVIVLTIVVICIISDIPGIYKTTVVGIGSFIVLVYIAPFFQYRNLRLVFESISKYTYPIFLFQHIVIFEVLKTFTQSGTNNLGIIELCCSLVIVFIIIAILSYWLNKVNNVIINFVKTLFAPTV
jgi:peptidoglycan/LPS O-acetylase OafA/YrhL